MSTDSERASTVIASRAPSSTFERHELKFGAEVPTPVPASPDYPKSPEPIINPFEWTKSKKLLTTVLCCVMSAVGGYATGSADATIPQQEELFGLDETPLLLGTTTYALAFAFAPMLLAPFSEIRGRKPVFLASSFLMAISSVGCGLANSFAGFLIARFFVGVGSSTFSIMCGGIITDIYKNEQRGIPMAIFAASAFFGTGLGPAISDIIVFHIDWRWIYHVQAIDLALLTIVSIFLLPETRQNVLLVRQADKLNKWQAICRKNGMEGLQFSGRSPEISSNTEKDVERGVYISSEASADKPMQEIIWYVRGEEEKQTLLQSIRLSIIRPVRLLFTEPIVFWFSMWIAFAWSVLYLALAGITITFQAAYPSFNQEQIGAIYVAITVAAVIGAVMRVTQELLFPAKRTQRHVDISTKTPSPSDPSAPTSSSPSSSTPLPPASYLPPAPEARLRFALWESLLFPVGLYWWAWTCRAGVPWIVPTMAVGCTFVGTYSIFLAVLGYTADSYHRLASSALAAQSLTRNILGALFPLASAPLFRALGTGPALSFLASVALVLSAVPAVLLVYGPRIRARSKIASEIMKEAE